MSTYGEEMIALIEARVQLRNVTRALEQCNEGVSKAVLEAVAGHATSMEEYLLTLTCEFRDNYKLLSDRQRSYEEQTKAILKRFADKDVGSHAPPDLPGFVWECIVHLENVSDFIGPGAHYKTCFDGPLDAANGQLRSELARLRGTNITVSFRAK
ncbi:hypothetical protein [Caballeronia novacaledonica]|uniref:Uncharacterized protein n=1 Tax=Caballeronia novacaledonica TaxID=1544861 RepID=A0AA37MHQ9_9BURK|nr:hypothetical protein [Caballeronia novacaledonica]GJH26278.1 hypothetical protein CBA19CS42_17200 [Caballeronia novacaledonica]